MITIRQKFITIRLPSRGVALVRVPGGTFIEARVRPLDCGPEEFARLLEDE